MTCDELMAKLRSISGETLGLEAKQAAAAIEELTRAVALLESDRDAERKLRLDAEEHIAELLRRCEQLMYMPRPGWISVEERLPPVDKEVLVVAYGSMMRIWNIHRLNPETADVCWECEDGTLDDMCAVTHWMPLPKPPKEET